jgi:hypothetical protein
MTDGSCLSGSGSVVVTEEHESPPPAAQADWFLQTLVNMTNNYVSLEFPVTLHVKGVTVTGIVMNGRAFFERWAEDLKRSTAFPKLRGRSYGHRDAEDDHPRAVRAVRLHLSRQACG